MFSFILYFVSVFLGSYRHTNCCYLYSAFIRRINNPHVIDITILFLSTPKVAYHMCGAIYCYSFDAMHILYTKCIRLEYQCFVNFPNKMALPESCAHELININHVPASLSCRVI